MSFAVRSDKIALSRPGDTTVTNSVTSDVGLVEYQGAWVKLGLNAPYDLLYEFSWNYYERQIRKKSPDFGA